MFLLPSAQNNISRVEFLPNIDYRRRPGRHISTESTTFEAWLLVIRIAEIGQIKQLDAAESLASLILEVNL